MKQAILMALLLASPALAQRADTLGERNDEVYGRPVDSRENRMDMVLAQFAYCAESSAQAMVDRILTSPLASDEEAVAVRKLASAKRDCTAYYPLPFSPTVVRNAFATVVYRNDHRKDQPADHPVGPPPSFAVAPAGVAGTDAQQAAWFMGAVANCVVYLDAASAHRLIIGPMDVPEEERRFAVLAPTIGRCTPANGPTLNVRVFRGFLANALLARAGKQGGTKN